jgi:RNA polymerase sigma factor (sigma-70 family)
MRARHESGSALPDLSAGIDSTGDDQAFLDARDDRRLSMILELPDRQRRIVLARYCENLSINETAARLGCAPGTVKAAIHQARQRLKQLDRAVSEERPGSATPDSPIGFTNS